MGIRIALTMIGEEDPHQFARCTVALAGPRPIVLRDIFSCAPRSAMTNVTLAYWFIDRVSCL